MKQVATIFLLFWSLQSIAQDPFSLPPDAEAFYNKAMPVINIRYKTLVHQTAAKIKGTNIGADSIRSILQQSGMLTNLKSMDIESLVVLVMTEIAKDNQQDLKGMMMEMKKINAQKKEMRQTQVVRQKPDSVKNSNLTIKNAGRINTTAAPAVDEAEVLQTRIQKYQDRHTTLYTTLSGLMKKISDTQDQIIQNLK